MWLLTEQRARMYAHSLMEGSWDSGVVLRMNSLPGTVYASGCVVGSRSLALQLTAAYSRHMDYGPEKEVVG